MAYESGYTSAVNSAESRKATEQQISASLAQQAYQQWLMQQQQDKAALDAKAETNAIGTMGAMTGGPQPPPPGQASQPAPAPPQMQPPPPGPPPGGAAPQPPGMGGGPAATAGQFGPPPGAPPPQVGGPPGAPPPPPQGAPGAQPPQPQGWKPSPAAPPSLGGGAAPPAAGASPAGGAPPMPPMPGAAPPGQDAGGAPGAQDQVKTLPPQWLSVPKAIEAMTAKGIPPEQQYATLSKMMPMINAQNNQALETLKIETESRKIATETYKAEKERRLAEAAGGPGKAPAPTAFEKEAQRLQELEAQGKTNTTEYKALKAHVARMDAPARTTVNMGGAGGGLTEDAERLAAEQYLATGQLPALYRDQKGRAAIMDLAAKIQKERGGDVSDVPGARAGFKADAASLVQRQRFVDTGNQFVKNMQSQADLVDKYMAKGTAGGVPALNKWIQSGRKAIAGDPDVTALDTAIRGLAREHQRIVTGVTSNAQLHVAAQETADQLLNIAQTPEQMRAAIKVMREEAINAIKAGQDEVADIRGRMKGGKKDAAAGAIPDGWTVKEH